MRAFNHCSSSNTNFSIRGDRATDLQQKNSNNNPVWSRYVSWLESSLHLQGVDSHLYARCILKSLSKQLYLSEDGKEICSMDEVHESLCEILSTYESDKDKLNCFVSTIIKQYIESGGCALASERNNDSIDSGVCPSPDESSFQNYDEAFPPLEPDPIWSKTSLAQTISADVSSHSTGSNETAIEQRYENAIEIPINQPLHCVLPNLSSSAPVAPKIIVQDYATSSKTRNQPSSEACKSALPFTRFWVSRTPCPSESIIPRGSTPVFHMQQQQQQGHAGAGGGLPRSRCASISVPNNVESMASSPKPPKSTAPRFVLMKCSETPINKSIKTGSLPTHFERSWSSSQSMSRMARVCVDCGSALSGREWRTNEENEPMCQPCLTGIPLDEPMQECWEEEDDKSQQQAPQFLLPNIKKQPTASVEHLFDVSLDDSLLAAAAGDTVESVEFCLPRVLSPMLVSQHHRQGSMRAAAPQLQSVPEHDHHQHDINGNPTDMLHYNYIDNIDVVLPNIDDLLSTHGTAPVSTTSCRVPITPSTHFAPIRSDDSMHWAYADADTATSTAADSYHVDYHAGEQYFVLRQQQCGDAEDVAAVTVDFSDQPNKTLPLKFKANRPDKDCQTTSTTTQLLSHNALPPPTVDTDYPPFSPSALLPSFDQQHPFLLMSNFYRNVDTTDNGTAAQRTRTHLDSVGLPPDVWSADACDDWLLAGIQQPISTQPPVQQPITNQLYVDTSMKEADEAREREEDNMLLRYVGNISLLSPLEATHSSTSD